MIEMYLLEQLVAVQTYGTLSAAAEHLFISQPSVSRAMRKLEDSLGVSLFERHKNKITLNETGNLAADYAREILKREAEMIEHVRVFDLRQQTIVVGSCAPGPLMPLLAKLTLLYSGYSISFDIDTPENIITGLENDKYSLIILSNPFANDLFFCNAYMDEKLFVSVRPQHPIANRRAVSFKDMDGQHFIMLAQVGIWEDIVRTNMPHAKFFRQENEFALDELSRYSDLPAFVTDISKIWMPRSKTDRVSIPFSDTEAIVHFYLVCKKNRRDMLEKLLMK